MGVVIGPVTQSDWNTMSDILQSIKWAKTKDRAKFDSTIKKEKELYRYYRDPYLTS